MSEDRQQWDERLEELVQRIRAGDAAAEDALCRHIYPSLLRRARSLITDEGMEGPDDAVKNALTKFIHHVKRYPAANLKPWPYLMRVLHNACLDILRRRKRLRDVIEEAGGEPGQQKSEPPLPPDFPWDVLRREVLKLKWPCPLLLLSIYYYEIPTKVLAALLLGRPVTLQAIFKRRDKCLKDLYDRLKTLR